MKPRNPVTILVIALAIFSIACSCNPCTLVNQLVNKTLEKSLSTMSFEKTGDVSYDLYGVSFTVPEGYTAMAGLGVNVAPKDADPTAPTFNFDNYPNSPDTRDYEGWVNSYKNGRNPNNELLSENPITVDGVDGEIFEMNCTLKNYVEQEQEYAGYCVSIVLNDTAHEQAITIDGTWKVEDTEAVRPIFDQWLSTIKIYEPVPLITPTPE
jgi:hypothetical protein